MDRFQNQESAGLFFFKMSQFLLALLIYQWLFFQVLNVFRTFFSFGN